MKIILISALYPPYARGGAERVAEITARGLKDVGHDVLVITAGPQDGYDSDPKMEEHDGVRVLRFFPPNLFFYRDIGAQPFWRRLFFHISDARNSGSAQIIGEILRKEKSDAVITENIKGIGFFIPRVIRELGIRHIHVLHDIQLIEPSGLACVEKQFHGLDHGTVRKTLVRRMWAAWMRRLWGSPDVVVCPSQWIANVHRAWGFFPRSRIEIIPNQIFLSGLVQFLIPNPQPRLLFVGQIERHKGVFDLVQAAKMIKEDFVMDIFGDGSARDELQRLTADDPRFVFHGRVESEKLSDFYAQATATVVPSRCLENAPTTISESFACGTPVIASSVGGIPEMIREGENGWLVPPGDIAALSAAMKKAIEQKNDPAIRDRARRSVEGRTSADYIQKISFLVPMPGAPSRE